MPECADQSTLKYGRLSKARLAEERARQRKLEEDKAKKEKDKPHPPWPAEAWQKAREDARLGVVEPEKRFPVIITSPMETGPFTTPEKLQEVADLPSTPRLKLTTLTSVLKEEAKELEKEEVQYCGVNWKQVKRVYASSEGKDVFVWFQGKRRFAWLAHSAKSDEEAPGLGAVEPERRFPAIITCSAGPFTTPKKAQKVANLPSTPEVKWTTLTSIFEDEAEELEKEEVQYCDVNWEQLERLHAYSEGKDVIVWFQGKRRAAWVAHSVKSSETEGGEEE